MTRTIFYLPIAAAAKTDYREIAQEEHNWIIQYLFRTLVKMGTLSNTTTEDLKTLRDQWWRKRRSTLPRSREGQNTPESMVAGILDNMLYCATLQRDFTQKQCDAIEDISNWMNAVNAEEFENIRFQLRIV